MGNGSEPRGPRVLGAADVVAEHAVSVLVVPVAYPAQTRGERLFTALVRHGAETGRIRTPCNRPWAAAFGCGIRDPGALAWLWRYLHVGVFALHYSSVKIHESRARADWKERCGAPWREHAGASIDVADLTPFVAEEIGFVISRWGWSGSCSSAAVGGAGNVETEDREGPRPAAGRGSQQDPLAVWMTRCGPPGFVADVRTFAASLPSGTAGLARDAR